MLSTDSLAPSIRQNSLGAESLPHSVRQFGVKKVNFILALTDRATESEREIRLMGCGRCRPPLVRAGWDSKPPRTFTTYLIQLMSRVQEPSLRWKPYVRPIPLGCTIVPFSEMNFFVRGTKPGTAGAAAKLDTVRHIKFGQWLRGFISSTYVQL